MTLAEILYLGVTITLFVIFAVIVVRTYRKDRKNEVEGPKYRMLDNDKD
jgi:hypothetical protein